MSDESRVPSNQRFVFRGRQPFPGETPRINCSICAHRWATAVDHLCDRCAWEETGLPEELFDDWRYAQSLYQRGLLQVKQKHIAQGELGKVPPTQKEELDAAEAVVRNTFGNEEVQTVAEFSYIAPPRNTRTTPESEEDRPPFLEKDQKETLARAETPFYVFDVFYFDKGKFGPKYFVKFEVDEGEMKGRWTWSVSAKGGGDRENKLAALHDHFQQPTASRVHSYLRMYDTERNPGFDIEFLEDGA